MFKGVFLVEMVDFLVLLGVGGLVTNSCFFVGEEVKLVLVRISEGWYMIRGRAFCGFGCGLVFCVLG